MAHYIQNILKNDFQIRVANNGQKGIDKAFEMIPDIIISDVMMPEKDGYEVCSILKNDERTSHIPIILLTAKAEQQSKVAGLKAGADAYLMKPFDKEELIVRLEKLLELRKQLQQKYSQTLASASSLKSAGNTEAMPEPSIDELFLQKLHKIVLEKMDDHNLGPVFLSKAVGLSQSQLYRKIKALIGETPSLFIRKARLRKAMELLKTTVLNISEVAYEVGFNDPNYFSRAFIKEFGKTPRDIRK